MAIYNVNQNRQFYVVSTKVDNKPANLGEFSIGKNKEQDQIFFKHFGKGGLTRSDLIDVDKICYARLTPATELRRKLKKMTVSLDPEINGGEPIVGQDYVLRVTIKNYLSPGDASVLIKSSAVHAYKGMTAEKFYEKMRDSLKLNFSRERQAGIPDMLDFNSDAKGVTVTELNNQPWRLGILSQEPVNFELTPTQVTYEGTDVIWGKVTKGIVEGEEGIVKNGKTIADLEYFCSAERGDMFRNMGYPYNIDVKMSVEPDKEYDVLDIHYFFSGNGVQVHKSEKDITFVAEAGNGALDAIKTELEGLNVKFTEPPTRTTE